MQALTDQVAVVTGAARGIGRGIASVLAAEGAHVVVVDVDAELGESTAAELGAASRSRPTSPNGASVESMAARVVEELGRIDILAANAGVYPFAELDALDEQVWNRVMDLNVGGAVRCRPGLPADDALARLRPDRADIVDHRADHRPAGVRALRRVEGGDARLHALGRRRARARAGSRSTPSCRGTSARPASPTRASEHQRRMLSSIPMGRYAEPEEVGWAVRFLASPEAAYITGQTLIVDGGQVLPEAPLG